MEGQAWKRDWPLFTVAVILGIGPLLSLMSLLDCGLQARVLAASVLAILVMAAFAFFLNPIIAKDKAFFFIQSLFAVSTHGASFFFFADGPKQYPNGTHLSIIFYTSWTCFHNIFIFWNVHV